MVIYPLHLSMTPFKFKELKKRRNLVRINLGRKLSLVKMFDCSECCSAARCPGVQRGPRLMRREHTFGSLNLPQGNKI